MKMALCLIFDEMVTGFRWALGGAQEYYQVTPDLACFGKAIANGFPLTCVCGIAEIMNIWNESEMFVTSTYSAELASIVAAVSTIRLMKDKNIFPHTHRLGRVLKDGLNELAVKANVSVECKGLQRMNLFFESNELPISV